MFKDFWYPPPEVNDPGFGRNLQGELLVVVFVYIGDYRLIVPNYMGATKIQHFIRSSIKYRG